MANKKSSEIPVEKKLDMSLGDINKARPKKQRQNVKAKKESSPGKKAEKKAGETQQKRGDKLGKKREEAGGGPKKKESAKPRDPNLPRIVVRVDLTKVGGRKQGNAKPAGGKQSKQTKKPTSVILH